MHPATRRSGCPAHWTGGNPYWVHFALVAFLLTWGVITRRRENIQRRAGLGLLAAFGWLAVFANIVARRMDDAEFWEALEAHDGLRVLRARRLAEN